MNSSGKEHTYPGPLNVSRKSKEPDYLGGKDTCECLDFINVSKMVFLTRSCRIDAPLQDLVCSSPIGALSYPGEPSSCVVEEQQFRI